MEEKKKTNGAAPVATKADIKDLKKDIQNLRDEIKVPTPAPAAVIDPDPAVPAPEPEEENFKPLGFGKKKGEKKMKNTGEKKKHNIGDIIITTLFGLLITAAIVAIVFLTLKIIATTPKAAAIIPASITDTTDETDETAAETSAFAKDFSLNDPANPSDVNSNIWNQVYDAGVMVGENGDVYYTQSGKDGSVLLHGKIEAGQTVVIDAYRLEKDDKIYSEGCILVLNGPVDFDTNPIFYTNGAAQIIATENTQKFLDENVWLKFSRGDRLADDSAWSYKTWALSNIWLPDGITFKELGLTAETDTYPSK